MAKKKSVASTTKDGQRTSWKGNIRFGLVSFAVDAFSALNRQASDIHFHQLHAKCHSRIHYQKVCPIHGVVSNDEIVSAYEYSKGKYVEIEPGELESLETENERALVVDAFVPPERIDARYLDGRMYYLLPSEVASHEAYVTIAAAMNKQNCYAVGQVVLSGKDQLVLIRSVDGVLNIAMLNYEAEILPVENFASGLEPKANSSRQIKLAESLIKDWLEPKFDFSKYTDHYRDRVQKLIDAKIKGKKIVAPKEVKEKPVTISLMDALKKSLGKNRTKKVPSRHSA